MKYFQKQLAELKTQENDLSIVGFQNISEEMDKIQLKIDNNKKYVEGMLTTHNPNDKIIKFMLKGPDQGTLETLRVQIHKLSKSYSDVKLQMLSSSVGNVSESDIRCAVHFKCMLFTMDVPISNEAMFLARKEKLIMKSSRLIFGLTDEIKKIIQAENDRVLEDHKMIGTAEVENIFEIKISRTGKIFNVYFIY